MSEDNSLISKFYFVGDLCLADSNSNVSDSFSSTCRRWQNLTNQADLTVANLESCIVENKNDCDRFTAVSQYDCGAISKSGIDVFSLANNHILDCGEEGLNFTKSYLHEMGIETVGAGKNIEKATAPLIITKRGKRIGIISTTDATHYKAKKHRAGISPLSLRRIKKSIKDILGDVDLVVLCIHSDLEFTNYPAPWKVRLSRQLARAGADIIVHHHPHTLQGIELYDGTLIAYSLGNFVFPIYRTKYMDNRHGNVNEAVILEVNIKFDGYGDKSISYTLIPTIIDKDNKTKFADCDEAETIIKKMSEYSTCLASRKKLRKRYLQLCLEQARNFVWGTYYTLCKSGTSSTYKYLHAHFSTKMHRNWMRGILTLGWF